MQLSRAGRAMNLEAISHLINGFCHSERSEESRIISGSPALPQQKIVRDVSLRST
jgi:hypothetical protein